MTTNTSTITVIIIESQYNEALVVIENYLKKGSNALSFDEKQELKRISLLVEVYEQQVYPMPIQTKP